MEDGGSAIWIRVLGAFVRRVGTTPPDRNGSLATPHGLPDQPGRQPQFASDAEKCYNSLALCFMSIADLAPSAHLLALGACLCFNTKWEASFR
jgi:hypothetical protein